MVSGGTDKRFSRNSGQDRRGLLTARVPCGKARAALDFGLIMALE
jgi:hypothetical protein